MRPRALISSGSLKGSATVTLQTPKSDTGEEEGSNKARQETEKNRHIAASSLSIASWRAPLKEVCGGCQSSVKSALSKRQVPRTHPAELLQ